MKTFVFKATTNSQLITLINEIQASTSGRKRAAGDLTSYVGYEFDSPGLAVVEDRVIRLREI